jgi:hypothetical protein
MGLTTGRPRRVRDRSIQHARRPEPGVADAATAGGERWWALGLLALGAFARIALWWVNPPGNSFDNHYQPVFLIVEHGALPDKFACFQCYHPPLFYVMSALVARALIVLGVGMVAVLKALQFLSCAFAIATTVVVYLVLRRLPPISPVGRLVALALVVFLPRHLYTGAMYSNDSAVCFFAVLSAHLVIRLVQGDTRWGTSLALALTATAAISTKYTGLAVLPMIAVAVAMTCWRDRWRLARGAVALAVPLVVLGAVIASHARTYGVPLPDNRPIYDAVTRQPRDPGGVSFTSFTPWQFIAHPVLRPGQLGSFWTLLFAGMWFDTEPRLALVVGDHGRWVAYYTWLTGASPTYREPPLPDTLWQLARSLEVLGLFWLLLGLTGAVDLVRRASTLAPGTRELVPLVVLLVFTFTGVGVLVTHVPLYSAMKASYVLGALPAFAGLAALGAERWQRRAGGVVVVGTAAHGAVVMVYVVYLLAASRS